MSDTVTLTVKVPKNIFAEIAIRVPEGERSNFVRDAIIEKLQRTPAPDKILELERRIRRIEDDLAQIKKSLADLELLTYERGKVNPYSFCIDEIDHKIMDYLTRYKAATTTELSEALKLNRWLILNRLKKIKRRAMKQIGEPIVNYFRIEKSGKKRAWWINQELIEMG
ncbi:MAG: hypothetical protein RMJ07_05095 [Nitrososphaerota archaeon]|nr:hypothetical protein [Candidatus Bathyarchaeota archaeon]MDW8049042.1 hypothetical protein [Nitrososphaerota archaeon]